MDELLEEFIAETRDTLEALTGELIVWEVNPGDRALLDSVFRFFHTMKGSCGFLDLPRFARLSHAAEDLLSAIRENRVQPTAALVDAVLAVIDRIGILTDALESGVAIVDDDEALIDALTRAANDEPEATEGEADGGLLIQGDRVNPGKLRTVRVSLSLLDKLMNGMSDLVLARNELSRHMRDAQVRGELDNSFGRLSGSIADMRDMIGLMRMQRIERLFSAIPRLVRDTAAELGKQIDLFVEGSDVEIDREMIESIRDPLTHIIRNSIDHGIESPGARVLAGKPATGQLRVTARQSGNQILLEIEDDGRGIDVDALVAKAIERGVVTAEQARAIDPSRRAELVFAAGLSTAQKVSEISGRGVGMDVVRNNVETLGGTVELDNHPGNGLRIILRLPLTLTIISALTVRSGDQLFAIPRNAVVEILRCDSPHIRIDSAGGAQLATVRGDRMPHASLSAVMGLAAEGAAHPHDACIVIVRPAVGCAFTLLVDSVVDSEELVVKPGAPMLMATGLYAGTSLPDSGRPLLLLDTSGIAAAIGATEGDRGAVTQAERNTAAAAAAVESADPALLFVDSAGRQRAIRLGVVERMIDVPATEIRLRAGRMRMVQDGALTFVLGLDEEPAQGFVKLLRLSDGVTPCYLAVQDVIDIFPLASAISASQDPMLEGVILHNGEQVELIDPWWVFEQTTRDGAAPATARRCHIASDLSDQWSRSVLAPLLRRSGYDVSFGDDAPAADCIILTSAASGAADVPAGRVLRLRSEQARDGADGSIWQHDRAALLDALDRATGAGR